MEVIERLILWILLSCVNLSQVMSGRVVLNGPPIQTSDLRAIDGYVASGLPLFADTHGFVLHSGTRPVIVKVKDPNKVIRDGIEQPNPGYYRDLPSVIPQGFEGIASTSFLLGNPIPPSNFFRPNSGPVVSFQSPNYHHQIVNPMQMNQQVNNNNRGQITPNSNSNSAILNNQPPSQQIQGEFKNNPQVIAESSIRVENTLNPRGIINGGNINNEFNNGGSDMKHIRNPVVVQTSEFESTLPMDYRNPFYSNEMVANMLAQESLPAPGEEVVDKWDTNKIREGRVRDLLSGAGLI